MPSRMWRKPSPSSPIERVGGQLEVVEEDLGGGVVHHRADRLDRQAVAAVAHVDEEHRQPVGLALSTSSSGVVRASRIIRSECSAREVQIFWPLTT